MTAIDALLIDAGGDRLRAATVASGRVIDLQEERRGNAESAPGAIHLGRVVRVVPGLRAAFIEIGQARPALLDYGRVAPREGAELIVQIVEAAVASEGKGGRVTTTIGLSGRYLVLRPSVSGVTYSRRLTDVAERQRLATVITSAIAGAPGCGAVIRAAAAGVADAPVVAEVAALLARWRRILDARIGKNAPTCLDSASAIQRLLQDFATLDPREIIVDAAIGADARGAAEECLPDLVERVTIVPSGTAFARYDVDDAIAAASERVVRLASGGRLIVDRAAALTAIDVDTGGSAGGGHALIATTNREAAIEIARQLRLRDLGGLIAIDFIRMAKREEREAVLAALRNAVAADRRAVEVLGFTRAGLVELIRPRGRGIGAAD